MSMQINHLYIYSVSSCRIRRYSYPILLYFSLMRMLGTYFPLIYLAMAYLGASYLAMILLQSKLDSVTHLAMWATFSVRWSLELFQTLIAYEQYPFLCICSSDANGIYFHVLSTRLKTIICESLICNAFSCCLKPDTPSLDNLPEHKEVMI